MKPDERLLLLAVSLKETDMSVRDVIESFGASVLNPKRTHYILQKWCDKGWYEYGVSLDLGWLTKAGQAAADKLKRGET